MHKNLLSILVFFSFIVSYAQVGIGTSTPSVALDVESSASNTAIDINNTAADGDAEVDFQLDGTTQFAIGIDDGDNDNFKITDGTMTAGTARLVIEKTGGNVGIGITDPSATLDVDGSAIFNESSNSVDFRIESNSNTHMFFVDGTNDEIGINTSTPASTLDIQGSLGFITTTITSATTLNQAHHVILASDASGSFTITLPAAASNTGKVYYIKKTNSSANTITIDGNGAETIDGAATASITTQYDVIRIICDGSAWHIISNKASASSAGNVSVASYYYHFDSSSDNVDFFNDGNVKFAWDTGGSDLEFYMLTEPGGSADMRCSTHITSGSTVYDTDITTANYKYDVFTAGVGSGYYGTAFISPYDDATYPSYRVTVYHTSTSYNATVVIEVFTP